MKKSKLFVLGGLTLGLAFSLFGFSRMNNETQMVKAEGASGTVKVYLGPKWAEADCNISVYFFDDANNYKGWGSYVFAPKDTFEVDISYNFEWTPVNMVAVRYNSTYSAETWANNPWAEGLSETKWNQAPASGGYAFSDHMAVTGWDTGDVEYPYIASSAVSYGKKMDLVDVKLNGSHHFEYYSDSVTFADNEEFKIVFKNVWYNNYTLADVVNSNFHRENNDANIKCLVAGTYSLYFDSENKSVHITDPVLAAADKWAQDFLNGECSGSKSNWGTAASDFDALSSDAKALLVNEIHISNDANADTYIKQAIQRYDYVLQRFGIGNANTDEGGYQDFMGRVSGGKLSLAPIGYRNTISEEVTDSNVVTILFITVTLLAAATGFLVIRRRKHNQ